MDEVTIRDEIRVLNSLDHPNIVRYFEEYENDRYIYLVMEYCEGETLLDLIEKYQA